jgi:prephenate dehydratase
MQVKVGYLGPMGSYSFLAAQKLVKDGEYVEYDNFYLLMQSLKNNKTQYIVLPIENSVNGGVIQNIDLMQENDEAFAFKSCNIKIDHRLVTLNGASMDKITAIYSHPQALGQCAKYLNKHFPNARLLQTPSTSGCLHMLDDVTKAGIVGNQCQAEGFVKSIFNIADNKHIFTQFLLVKIQKQISLESQLLSKRSIKRVFFSLTCKHEAGALVKILQQLSEYNINMTRIESRPIKERVGEYRFFIEVETGADKGATLTALNKVSLSSNSFRLIGCY